MLNYIHPLFNDQPSKKLPVNMDKPESRRTIRKDKLQNIKFPVDTIMQMKLRSMCKQASRINSQNSSFSQTKFNTLMLSFGIRNDNLIDWNISYKDTGTYMHTKSTLDDYQLIGGPYGFAVQKGYSERKSVYIIIRSILNWIERGGSLDNVLQQP